MVVVSFTSVPTGARVSFAEAFCIKDTLKDRGARFDMAARQWFFLVENRQQLLEKIRIAQQACTAARAPLRRQGNPPPLPAGPDPGPAAAVLAQPRVTELPAVNPAARAFFQSTGVCYVAFDTETTNLQYATDGVITIAAKELGTEASFCQLVDPQRDIDPAAKAVHGISNAMLAGQPLWPEAAARFWRWLMNLAGGGRPIVLIAHNAPFDVSIIRTENARWNLTAPVPIEVIDTFPLFRDLKSAGIIGVESLGLRSIALQLLNFEMPQQHDALGDASALARLCELPNVRSYLNARRLPAWRVPPPAFWNGFNRPPAPANLQPREAVRLLHSACLTVLARRSEIGWPVEEVIGGGGPDARTRLKAAVLDEGDGAELQHCLAESFNPHILKAITVHAFHSAKAGVSAKRKGSSRRVCGYRIQVRSRIWFSVLSPGEGGQGQRRMYFSTTLGGALREHGPSPPEAWTAADGPELLSQQP